MSESVNILFVGDIYFGERPHISVASEIKQILKSADLVVANQEGPITDRKEAIGGKCCLKSAPETANILQSWGVDVVSLANNHMFDYGLVGFEQTRQQLDNAGIRYLGAGKNLEQASRPLIVDVKGRRIGLLAYSWEFVQTTCASADSYGCAPLEKELMVKQIRSIKNEADTVIVLPHWGYWEYPLPSPEHVELGESLIKAGAAAVIGHHSHMVQGITIEGGNLMAFSLGNFAFARYRYGHQNVKLTKENLNGVILSLVLEASEVISYELIHTRQEKAVIVRDNSERRRAEFAKRQALLLSTDYAKHWRCYLRRRLFKRILYWMNVLHWRNIHKETIAGAFLMLRHLLWSKSKK